MSLLTVLSFTGTGTGCGDDEERVRSITFVGVEAPDTETEKQSIIASTSVNVDGDDQDIGFNTILRSGDTVGGGTFGLIYDQGGHPVLGTDGANFISNDNDFSSLLLGKTDGKIYMVSHFETVPSAMYVTELNQSASDGKLTPVQTRNIDFSSFKGGWVHCAGSVTPWGTHLGSEEYEPDARNVNPDTGKISEVYKNIARYFGLDPDATDGSLKALNAYHYGWQIEVEVKSFADVTAVKHYSMGRLAHELGKVMPNQKTVYIADDGANVGLFRYEADAAGNLTAGELFVAKWNQTGTANGGSATLSWISLGKATDAEVKALIDGGTKFADIFETVDAAADGTCVTGFTAVNQTYSSEAYVPNKVECLKVKAGKEKAASRLETRRYAALLGGTTEFNKMEGITLDPDTRTLYVAMSDVSKGMTDNDARFDKGGPNHIKLPANSCGTVYALALDTSYLATSMTGVVSGTPKTYDAASPFASYTCDADGIASPDNLTFMPGYDTLIIGEDTAAHQNDVVWSYNIKTAALTRIQTTPYGSETTSVYFYPNIKGWAYVMSVIQHPYGESDQGKLPAAEAKRAYTGYLGPFPAMD